MGILLDAFVFQANNPATETKPGTPAEPKKNQQAVSLTNFHNSRIMAQSLVTHWLTSLLKIGP
jgi:hypothetical protein